MNSTVIKAIFAHYIEYYPRYGTIEDRSSSRIQTRQVYPFERLKKHMDISNAIVLANENGEWVKGPAKEMFYRQVKAINGDWGNAQGLYLIPSIDTIHNVRGKKQPCCYAFTHSYPIFKFPYCIYDLLSDRTYAPTKIIVHLASVHPKGMKRDFRIVLYHYFERSKEGQEIVSIYNYRQNSSEYLQHQIFYKIEQIQRWSGRYFISVEDV